MIYNIRLGTFGGPLRMGDLVGVANVVAALRRGFNFIQFFIEPNAIHDSSHVKDFYAFLLENTNYFSSIPGDEYLSWKNVNIWDYRDKIGDVVKIKNVYKKKDKIVICPVLDDPYNTYRNWPKQVLVDIIEDSCCWSDEIVLCVADEKLIHDIPLPPQIKVSTNFNKNLVHIMQANTFYGGDTGTSHFAWALDDGPSKLIYVNSSRGLIHTAPFNLFTKNKGTLKTYWMDFEKTDWGTHELLTKRNWR